MSSSSVFTPGNPTLLRRYVDDVGLPNLARVISAGRSATIEQEPDLNVGAVCPTLLTGVGVDRHGFYTGMRPAPRSYASMTAPVEADPFLGWRSRFKGQEPSTKSAIQASPMMRLAPRSSQRNRRRWSTERAAVVH